MSKTLLALLIAAMVCVTILAAAVILDDGDACEHRGSTSRSR